MAPAQIKRVVSKGRAYLYFWPSKEMMAKGARPVRLPNDPAEAKAHVARLSAFVGTEQHAVYRRYLVEMLKGARRRCAKSGTQIDLTIEDVLALAEAQGYRCAVSGIPFDMETTGPNRRAFRKPFRPSLDRKAHKGPYTLKNVRLVCVAVNVALNEWGDHVLRRIALGIAEQETLGEQRLENDDWKTLPAQPKRPRG